MGDYESLLQLYREDVLIRKIEEVHQKWKNVNSHKKIVRRERDIYNLDLNDKFNKFPNIVWECLLEVNFTSKDCFKLFQVIYKLQQRKGRNFITCKKMYLLKQIKINRMTLHRSISELEEKKMLLVETHATEFKFVLNMAPLLWNVSESEKEKIEQEVIREIERVDKKWIREEAI